MTLKTRPNDADVDAFLTGVPHEGRRRDGLEMLQIMSRLTGAAPRMWGASIVGFGSYTYVNATQKPAQWMRTGFSPRKASMSIYVMCGFDGFEEIVARIGKVKTSVSCLYVTSLDKIDRGALEELIAAGWERMNTLYPDD
ncbi:MAG: DUF1801 domain-containing protein [Pseudomonadota bacterium]